MTTGAEGAGEFHAIATLKVHLYTTDISGLALLDMLEPGHEASAVVIPSNRGASGKVAAVRAKAPVQVVEHPRGERLPDNIPAADAVLSWLYSQLIAPNDLERYRHGGSTCMGAGYLTTEAPVYCNGPSSMARTVWG